MKAQLWMYTNFKLDRRNPEWWWHERLH